MSAIRMQSRYWKLLIPAIELAKEDLNKKYDHWEKVMENPNKFSAEDTTVYNNRMREILDDIKRYDAILKLVKEASEKRDSFFSSGIGPDEPEVEPLTQNEEDFLRVLEQID